MCSIGRVDLMPTLANTVESRRVRSRFLANLQAAAGGARSTFILMDVLGCLASGNLREMVFQPARARKRAASRRRRLSELPSERTMRRRRLLS